MDLLPMFPLGGVHFPHTLVPLQVFEQRYLDMMQRCIDGDRRFGVVLIERGAEVGGGDSRFDVGTMVEIRAVSETPDGRLAVVAEGIERITIDVWLPDDPYPQALVSPMVEPEPGIDAQHLVGVAVHSWDRMLALASELGIDTAGSELDLPDDPVIASYHLAAVVPIGSLDAQRLLELPSVDERIERIIEVLDEEAAVMEAQLGGA